tara:strand:- start:4497 stop:5159 length:663 start_codon:yes stop_codon:yes gene_type:complete
MIGWLKGKPIDLWNKVNKTYVLISTNDIGYEVQLLPREHLLINKEKNLNLWIHQLFREDEIILYGFQEKFERNLFRKLIEVNGIGPQIAISLLDKYNYIELLIAIRCKDFTKLASVSGIGKRIAERLIIELKDKLNEFNEILVKVEKSREEPLKEDLHFEHKQELKQILKDLNYDEEEIYKSIKAVYENKPQSEDSKYTLESNLKEALVWLSQDLARKGA